MPHKDKAAGDAYQRAYYQRNKERIKARVAAYTALNKEAVAEYQKAYQQDNQQKLAAYRAAYYDENRDALLAQQKEYTLKHREYIAARKVEYYKKNPLKYVKIRAERYGLTCDQLLELYRLQDHCCGVCNTHESLLRLRLCVDHDHASGEVRGLLCVQCNLAVGRLGDSAENVRRALPYFEQPRDLRFVDSEAIAQHQKSHRKDARQRARRFGITYDQLTAMYIRQGDACAICNTPETELSKSLAVDHDHDTGEIRGLLCNTCNSGIGSLGDTAEGVLRAVKYLEDFESCNV